MVQSYKSTIIIIKNTTQCLLLLSAKYHPFPVDLCRVISTALWGVHHHRHQTSEEETEAPRSLVNVLS